MAKRLVVGCSMAVDMAKSIARRIGADFSPLSVGRFPDGELRIKFTAPVKGRHVVLVQTLHPANEPLLELIFALHTAQELGAASVTLAVPYMAYLRQDKRFHPGECVSNKIVANLLRDADRVITIDPHLHRVKHLREIFHCPVTTLSANALLAGFIGRHYRKELILGPDEESYQWAARIAEKVHAHAVVLRKKRYGSRKVSIKIKGNVDIRGKTVVIVDDIISSGHTMMETIKEAKRLGAKRIICITVHGIFAENALNKIRKLGAIVHATNTVKNPCADIDVAGVLADALR
jgi:ribose-phosphate pyrophosphokinase